MEPFKHVTGVRMLGRYVVELDFDDTERRIVDLEPLMEGPAFDELLADYELFCRVTVDDDIATIAWPTLPVMSRSPPITLRSKRSGMADGSLTRLSTPSRNTASASSRSEGTRLSCRSCGSTTRTAEPSRNPTPAGNEELRPGAPLAAQASREVRAVSPLRSGAQAAHQEHRLTPQPAASRSDSQRCLGRRDGEVAACAFEVGDDLTRVCAIAEVPTRRPPVPRGDWRRSCRDRPPVVLAPLAANPAHFVDLSTPGLAPPGAGPFGGGFNAETGLSDET